MSEKKRIFAEWPIWDQDDTNAVQSVVQSGHWWCGAPEDQVGENVWAFQQEFADFQEADHCIAVSNGTVALEAALHAFGIGLGDEVIVSDYTFFASASAVVAVNAVPIFCDICPDTLVMDVEKAAKLITPRTRAVIAVHLAGNPIAMDELCDLANRNNLRVIEDCAHAQGSRYRRKRVGTWGDAGTFSFQASKVLTAGEGGAIVCRDSELAERIYSVTDCGRKRGDYFYAHHEYGANFRMPELSAALLRCQLRRFPSQHKLRNKNVRYLTDLLSEVDGITVMKPTPGTDEIGYYVYPILFDPDHFGGMSAAIFSRLLNKGGIPTDDCYPPLHTLNCFREKNLRKGVDYTRANWGNGKESDFSAASDVFSRSVQFPHQVLLSSREALDFIADFIANET